MLRRHEVIQSSETVSCHICGRLGHYYKGHNSSPLGTPIALCRKHLPTWATIREIVLLVKVIQGIGHYSKDVPFASSKLANNGHEKRHPYLYPSAKEA